MEFYFWNFRIRWNIDSNEIIQQFYVSPFLHCVGECARRNVLKRKCFHHLGFLEKSEILNSFLIITNAKWYRECRSGAIIYLKSIIVIGMRVVKVLWKIVRSYPDCFHHLTDRMIIVFIFNKIVCWGAFMYGFSQHQSERERRDSLTEGYFDR